MIEIIAGALLITTSLFKIHLAENQPCVSDDCWAVRARFRSGARIFYFSWDKIEL
jgi:hypothetical protein